MLYGIEAPLVRAKRLTTGQNTRLPRIAAALGAASSVLAIYAACAQPASAEPSLLPEIFISANRGETDRSKVGSSVTVITSEELDEEGQTTIVEYLNRVPGVNISQSGGPGALSTVNIRGAKQEYIQVRVDGIEISDPAGLPVAADISHLLVSDIDRIEVLRGSQSALYGGEAVGGVIDITTKSGRNTKSLTASAEGGSYGTGRGAVSATVGGERADLTVSVQHFETEGFSAANEKDGNTEDDGYTNTTLSAKGSVDITDTFKLFAAGRHTEYDLELDGGFPFGDTNDWVKGTQSGVRGGGEFTLFDGRSWNELSIQYFGTGRDYRNGDAFDGTRTKAEYLGRFEVHDRFNLTYGGDWTGEDSDIFASFTNFSAHSEIAGVFGQATWEPMDGLTLSGSLRHDEHSRFGGFDTFRLTAAYQIHENTLLRTSYGTGFRAPSHYELFDPTFGNAALQPEESESFDIGIEQTLLNGDMVVAATFFVLDTENLIQFVFPAGYTQTLGSSRRSGIELEGHWSVNSWLTLGANYTYIETEDPNGARLLRVPMHDIGLSADIRPADRWLISLSGSIVADVIDFGPVQLDDYFLLNGRIAYQVNDHLEAYVRAVNLLNQDYETVNGYGTAGFSVYAGLTARLGDR